MKSTDYLLCAADSTRLPHGPVRLLHGRLTGPNAGLEEPAPGGTAREATQRRLFTAASSDVTTGFASAPL